MALSGQSYSYRVRAYNTGGYSPYSNIATIVAGAANQPPTAPTNLTATALTSNSIVLTWTNGSGNQTEIRIERCQGSGCTNFAQVGVVAGTATTYTDGSLAAWTTYKYRVRAHNALGDLGVLQHGQRADETVGLSQASIRLAASLKTQDEPDVQPRRGARDAPLAPRDFCAPRREPAG